MQTWRGATEVHAATSTSLRLIAADWTSDYLSHSSIIIIVVIVVGIVRRRHHRQQVVSPSLRRPLRYGYLPPLLQHSGRTIGEDSDEILFFLSRYKPNRLHRLLHQPKNIGYNLRQRTHNLALPTDVGAVIKQNFVYRMLFIQRQLLCFMFYCYVISIVYASLDVFYDTIRDAIGLLTCARKPTWVTLPHGTDN